MDGWLRIQIAMRAEPSSTCRLHGLGLLALLRVRVAIGHPDENRGKTLSRSVLKQRYENKLLFGLLGNFKCVHA